jgi:hypothetical protein
MYYSLNWFIGTKFFKRSFRFTKKLSRNYREFLCNSCPFYAPIASPSINTQHQSGASVTTDEPTLKHLHLQPIGYIRAALGVVYSMGFDKCRVTLLF